MNSDEALVRHHVAARAAAALRRGQSLPRRSESSHELDFDIDVHDGAGVRDSARAGQASEMRAIRAVDSVPDYCRMWSDKPAAATSVSVNPRCR